MSIAILTPTRQRPTALLDMFGSIISYADSGAVKVYVGIDEDDQSYSDLFIDTPIFKRVVGPRQQLAGWTNDLARMAIEDGYSILASFGDDHRARTWAWDLRVIEAFDQMGSGLVYTRDGLQDERLPTAPFWSADIVRELGWFFPPVLRHLYADDAWLRFARDIGRCTYLPDVLIEHLHPSATGAEPDAINVENDSHYGEDRAAFEAFVASDEYRDCVERVKAIL